MNRFLTLLAVPFLFASGLMVPGDIFLGPHSARADGELMSPTIASQLDLEQVWRRQLSVPAGAQSIVDQQIFVHLVNQREYVEIVRAGAAEGSMSKGSMTKGSTTKGAAEGSMTKGAAEGSMTKDAAEGSMTKGASDGSTTKGSTTKGAAEGSMTKGSMTKGSTTRGDNPNAGHVLVRIPTDRVGRKGVAIGKAEAERLARNEIRRLDYRGIKGKITTRLVPRIRLYTLSDDGSIECRDAESGELIWLARVGDRRLGYGKVGVDDQYVSIVNGANLIKLDATNGNELTSERTANTPLFGAVNAGRFTLIPTIRNGVDGYPNYKTDDPPFQEMVSGLALAPPSKSPTSTKVAWGTSRGFVYVMELSGRPSVMFRLNTDGIVSGGIAGAKGDRFYFGSEVGQVYAVHASRSGKVLWSKPYGEPFYDAPILLGDTLFLRSTYGNLFSINTASGIMNWAYPVPSVGKLMGAFDGKIFVQLMSGGFSVVDIASGKTIGSYFDLKPGRLLGNQQSDRLYLVGKSGAVQCLRPSGATIPTFNDVVMSTPVMEKPKMTAKAEGPTGGQDATAPAKSPFEGGGADPFGGGGADPFGGGGGGDPFGAGDAGSDPFGGGDDKKKEGDPFADPFN